MTGTFYCHQLVIMLQNDGSVSMKFMLLKLSCHFYSVKRLFWIFFVFCRLTNVFAHHSLTFNFLALGYLQFEAEFMILGS